MCEELVKRLREPCQYENCVLCVEAADAIEGLSKQVELEHQSGFADGQIAANRKKSRWIPVKERMPEILNTVIVYARMRYKWEADYIRFVDAAVYTGEGTFETFNDWYEGKDEFEITHWQPFPEPPKEVLHHGNAQT